MKSIVFILCLGIFLQSFFAGTQVVGAQEQEKPAPIDLELAEIEYDLPYPGMLPDHPLYVLKSTRDAVMIFLTRDYMKKSELMLLLSDKYVAMSMALANEGQWGAAAEALQQSEETFADMIESVKTSESQGVSPSEEFVRKIGLSNDKHKEVIQELLVTAPQGSRSILEGALHKNNEFRNEIKKLPFQQ